MTKRKVWAVAIGFGLIAIWIGAIAIAQTPGPVTGDGIVAFMSGHDEDGDDIWIVFDWWCNGIDNFDYDEVVGPFKPPYADEGMSIIPKSANLLKSEVWTAKIQVRDVDGLLSEPVVEVSVTIGGVPPTAGAARIEVLQTPPPPFDPGP